MVKAPVDGLLWFSGHPLWKPEWDGAPDHGVHQRAAEDQRNGELVPLCASGGGTFLTPFLFVCRCVQFLHKLTARAVIRDYEDGNLDADGAQHEVGGGKRPKSQLRS